MKVLEWQETDTHYIAVVRPKELFDLSTLEKPHPEARESRLLARHLLSNQMEGYAIAFGKGYPLQIVQGMINHYRDVYSERDADDLNLLKELRNQSQQRKTA